MRLAIGLLVAAVALAGARTARVSLRRAQGAEVSDPYVPSPTSAPYLTLGYREAAADLLFVRLIGYFSGEHSKGANVASLAEAIVALDPKFQRVYDMGANAMMVAREGVDQSIYLRAIRLLEQGMTHFRNDWRLPYLAGQIYTQDLTGSPTQRRAWDERGVLLIESAIRKPGAPLDAAHWAAVMRTKLGQRERAAKGLRELILITSDTEHKKRLIEQLAKIQEQDSVAIASELFDAHNQFARAWKAQRTILPPTMFILLGARLQPGFEMVDLATGGRNLLEQTAQPLEPVE